MSHQQAIQLFNNLPAEMQQEVVHFIEFLASKSSKQTKPDQKTSVTSRKPGIRKGFIRYMAEDFDAPLEDFKDYM